MAGLSETEASCMEGWRAGTKSGKVGEGLEEGRSVSLLAEQPNYLWEGGSRKR